jgi:hypothetical protein
VLDLCVDQLEALAWGDPADDVQMTAPRPLLEAIARDLADAGQECLTNPLGEYRPHAQAERRQGRRMIRAADAINEALASGSRYQMAS